MSLATTGSRAADAQTGERRHQEDHGNRSRLPLNAGQEPKQESLPPLKWLFQPDADRFAHPAEIELARLLTFYGIRWAYEPTTFALRWDDNGRPEELVTPDFYLPDHDLYLELTTMRQRLVTRKNRKFRLLREHYPNVRVRILYLRDFERIQRTYGSPEGEEAARMGAILYAAEELEARVSELAEEVVATWETLRLDDRVQRPLLLGVGKGSRRFLELLGGHVHARGLAVDLDRVDLTMLPSGARVRVSRPPTAPLAGRPVIVVQEVLSTGLSAAFLDGWLRRHGALCVNVCALLDREAARILDVPLTYRGFAAPDVSLAGFGLTRWGEYQDLPYIAEIQRE
jgi:hypoxanthine-guanine phosphoribosyltransferase